MKSLILAFLCLLTVSALAQRAATKADIKYVYDADKQVTFMSTPKSSVVFVKQDNHSSSVVANFYLDINIPDSKLTENERGVSILFTDNSEWVKETASVKIITNENGSGYVYNSIVELNIVDVEMIRKKTIKQVTVGVRNYQVKNGDFLKSALNVLVTCWDK